MTRTFLIALLMVISFMGYCQEVDWRSLTKYEQYQLFELKIENNKHYSDPFRDVELIVELTGPGNQSFTHYGFFDGDGTWRIRFSPFINGIWVYRAYFSDGSGELKGAFGCIESDKPGMVGKNKYNPFWLGKGYRIKDQFRSFHVGDKFMALNWDDPSNPDDGNYRELFLDWLQEQGYNMLSIGSLFTNRNEPERGEGWDTPGPWPLEISEYRNLEIILDDLRDREITVFPFAGFFGLKGEWPLSREEQELYIKYILARLGHYPNLIFNVAGPEPAWRKESSAYKLSMRVVDINRLGKLIDSLDVHNHILTVHNEKRATQYGDPFIDEEWYSMSTLQGPTSVCREELFSGLSMNHHRHKPSYAQETLWSGNVFHPDYSLDQLRRNALTILFSGNILNFADNKGKSSSGFSGSLDPADANQPYHDVLKEVWDWFDGIPFNRLISRQDLVKQGFCLAAEGEEYYVYLDTITEVELFIDFGYNFNSRWINASDPSEILPGPVVRERTIFTSPHAGNDWILHVYASKPEVIGNGNFPNAAVDKKGNVHVVYNRGGLIYRKLDVTTGVWSREIKPGCACENAERSAPKIVIDSKDQPHVFCGREYAYFDGKRWNRSFPGGTRDTDMAIDSKDNIYLVYRGGNNGGHIGLKKRLPGQKEWITMPDPDFGSSGYNNHVYCDIEVGPDDVLHLVQRKGPEVEVTYRQSRDSGNSWPVIENVVNQWDESPHIAIGNDEKVYITSGIGELFLRKKPGEWESHGQKILCRSRMMAFISLDQEQNIYISGFGGRVNTCYKSEWMGEKLIEGMTGNPVVGFVKTAPALNFSYIIWEEGNGNAEHGLQEDASVVIGKLYPDGRLIGIN